jgi:hypothetical protein
MKKFILFFAVGFLITSLLFPQSVKEKKGTSTFKLARMKYAGGGDWYNDPSAEINMMKFLKQNTTIDVGEPDFYAVDVASDEIFNYPFIIITGHGIIDFTDVELARLRKYCDSGGFLYADDDYGMDDSFRKEMKRLFPNDEMKELPFDHKIYNSHFNFPHGLPKTHEHDGKPAQGFAIYRNGRMCMYYTYETNITDGWADTEEHQDPPEKREEAMKMGANIIVYALMN